MQPISRFSQCKLVQLVKYVAYNTLFAIRGPNKFLVSRKLYKLFLLNCYRDIILQMTYNNIIDFQRTAWAGSSRAHRV